MYHTFLTLKGGFLAIEKCFSLPTGEVGAGPVMTRPRRIVAGLRRMSIGTEGLVLGRRAQDARPRGR
jgi:hypothetical protein